MTHTDEQPFTWPDSPQLRSLREVQSERDEDLFEVMQGQIALVQGIDNLAA